MYTLLYKKVIKVCIPKDYFGMDLRTHDVVLLLKLTSFLASHSLNEKPLWI